MKAASSRIWAFQARYAPYLFVAPFALLFLAFMVYPLARSAILSFQQTNGSIDAPIWVGGQNFAFLPRTNLFWISVANSAAYTIAIVALQIPASLLLAVLLNAKWLRGRNFFRFAFFSPYLVGGVFVAVIFNMMLSKNGPVNRLLHITIPWMNDPVMARFAVVIASFWLSVGYGMVYFLAALQSVDKELYEASQVDGAGKWSQFWHVTIPGIRPVLGFLILTGTIGGLQMFELPYVLFQGSGPGQAGTTIVAYLFYWIELNELGTAAATGWLLAVVIIAISILQLWFTRRKESA